MKTVKCKAVASFGIALGAAFLLGAAGCKNGTSDLSLPHKLVATGGQHTIAMYPDEPTFMKVAGKAQEGGIGGAVGDVQKQIEAKQIDDQTPTRFSRAARMGTRSESPAAH
jgi:hypothetical protein